MKIFQLVFLVLFVHQTWAENNGTSTHVPETSTEKVILESKTLSSKHTTENVTEIADDLEGTKTDEDAPVKSTRSAPYGSSAYAQPPNPAYGAIAVPQYQQQQAYQSPPPIHYHPSAYSVPVPYETISACGCPQTIIPTCGSYAPPPVHNVLSYRDAEPEFTIEDQFIDNARESYDSHASYSALSQQTYPAPVQSYVQPSPPAPVQSYVQPSPPAPTQSYAPASHHSYSQPSPQVQCPNNVLIGCNPTAANVPCSSY